MDTTYADAIIIGGSYAGLAAARALGRGSKQVLVIDSGSPCNRQTPLSITSDLTDRKDSRSCQRRIVRLERSSH